MQRVQVMAVRRVRVLSCGCVVIFAMRGCGVAMVLRRLLMMRCGVIVMVRDAGPCRHFWLPCGGPFVRVAGFSCDMQQRRATSDDTAVMILSALPPAGIDRNETRSAQKQESIRR
jgi:hypothetical protein